MGYRLRPPVAGFSTFEILRQPGDDYVELRLFDTDTYVLGQGEAALWLQQAGCNQPDRLLDLVWNFSRISYDLREQTFEIRDLPSEDADRELRILDLVQGTPTPIDLLYPRTQYGGSPFGV